MTRLIHTLPAPAPIEARSILVSSPQSASCARVLETTSPVVAIAIEFDHEQQLVETYSMRRVAAGTIAIMLLARAAD